MMNWESYLSLYKTYEEVLSKDLPDFWRQARCQAYARLPQAGEPSFAEAYAIDWGLNIQRCLPQGKQQFPCDLSGFNAYQVLLVNDTYQSANLMGLPQGVVLCSMREAARSYPDLLASYFAKLQTREADEQFNLMMAQDGLFLYVPDGVKVDKPIQLMNVLYANAPLMAVSHNVIIIGKQAHAQVLVCDHAYTEQAFFANRWTEVFVDEGATYEHYKVESTQSLVSNVCTLSIAQQRDSRVCTNVITLHNGQTCNRVYSALRQQGSTLSLNGLCIAGAKQRVDNLTRIVHEKSNTTSSELFKYILDNEAQGNFYGLIKVMPGAVGTLARQTNRNLCLTDKARMQSKPQLEIYADDVKCNHGATVGQLDENALFYLRSRGISESEARLLLMSAFVYDVLDNVHIEALKDRLRLLIERRLRGEASACKLCNRCAN